MSLEWIKIDKRKTALTSTIPPMFDGKNVIIIFGPLSTKFTWLYMYPPKINYAHDFEQQEENGVINCDPFHVRGKKFGELWSLKQLKPLIVTHPKMNTPHGA